MALAGILEIQLLAEMGRLQTDMRRAEKVVSDSTAAMGKNVAHLEQAFGRLGGTLSLGLAFDAVRRLSDDYTKLTAQIRIATHSQAEYAAGLADVRRISTAAQADLSATTALYARMTNSLRDYGVTQKQVSNVTETVSLGLKAYGATSTEAASAMLQLSQAFASNRLGGDEFRAMMESMPNIMHILADSMGKPYAALKTLSAEGKITNADMLKAWDNPAVIAALQKQADMTRTITGELTVFRNNLKMLVGEFMGASGSTSGITSAIRAMSDAVLVLAENLKVVLLAVTVLSLAYAGKFLVNVIRGIELTIAHSEALRMNAAMKATAAVNTEAHTLAQVQSNAASVVATLNTLRGVEATAVATTATLAKTVADNAATLAQLNHAKSVAQLSGHYYIIRQVEAELVVTTAALAAATEAHTTALAYQTGLQANVASQMAKAVVVEKELAAATAATAAAQTAASASAVTGITAVGVAMRTAIMANPILAAATAIGLIVVAIANWKDIVDGSKASLKWFREDFLGGMEFLAAGVGISLGELVSKISLLANLTMPQLKSGEFKKQWDELGKLAEQSRIEAAARIAGLDKVAAKSAAVEAVLPMPVTQKGTASIGIFGAMAEKFKDQISDGKAQVSNLEKVNIAYDEMHAKQAIAHGNTKQLAQITHQYGTEMAYVLARSRAIALDDIVAAEKIATKNKGIEKSIAAINKETFALTHSKEELALYDAQALQSAIIENAKAAALAGTNGQLKTQSELLKTGALLEQQRAADGAKAQAEAAHKIAAENKKLADSFSKSFEDSFMKILDGGKSMFGQLAASASAYFKKTLLTTVYDSSLKPYVDKMSVDVAGMLKGGMGSSTVASAMPYVTAAVVAASALGGLFSHQASAQQMQAIDPKFIQQWQGTGTVLGDISAKSTSVATAMDTLNKTTFAHTDYLAQMTTSMRSVDKGINNFITVAGKALNLNMASQTPLGTTTSQGISSGANALLSSGISYLVSGAVTSALLATSIGATVGTAAVSGMMAAGASAGLALGAMTAGVGLVLTPIIGSLLGGLFGSSSTSITGTGVNFGGTTRQLQAGQGGQQYTSGVTSSSSLFGLVSDSSTWTQYAALDAKVTKAIGNIFKNIGDTITVAAASLGGDVANITRQVNAFVISTGNISMAGMTVQQQQQALSDIISQQSDLMVAAIVPSMRAFQVSGEGLLQTLVRVVSEMATVTEVHKIFGERLRSTIATADTFITSLGGVDAANQILNKFISDSAPQAVKTALAFDAVKAALSSAGVETMPLIRTMRDYYALVRSSSMEQRAILLLNEAAFKNYTDALAAEAQRVSALYQREQTARAQIAQATGNVMVANAAAVSALLDKQRQELNATDAANLASVRYVQGLEMQALVLTQNTNALALGNAIASSRTTNTVTMLSTNIDVLMKNISQSINNLMNNVKPEISAVIGNLQGVAQAASGAAKSLYQNLMTATDPTFVVRQSQAALAELAKMKDSYVASGVAPDAGRVQQLISQLGNGGTQGYASYEAWKSAQLQSINILGTMGGLADTQLTVQQHMASTLDAISAAMSNLATATQSRDTVAAAQAQAQIDALTNNMTWLRSVGASVLLAAQNNTLRLDMQTAAASIVGTDQVTAISNLDRSIQQFTATGAGTITGAIMSGTGANSAIVMTLSTTNTSLADILTSLGTTGVRGAIVSAFSASGALMSTTSGIGALISALGSSGTIASATRAVSQAITGGVSGFSLATAFDSLTATVAQLITALSADAAARTQALVTQSATALFTEQLKNILGAAFDASKMSVSPAAGGGYVASYNAGSAGTLSASYTAAGGQASLSSALHATPASHTPTAAEIAQLKSISNVGPQQLYDAMVAMNVNPTAYLQNSGSNIVTPDAWFTYNHIRRVPGFAMGGDHTGGVRLVGELGPELEATGPSRVTNTNNLMRALSNPQANSEALVAEVRMLREEVAQLRAHNSAENASMIGSMQRQERIVDKWDRQGLPETATV